MTETSFILCRCSDTLERSKEPRAGEQPGQLHSLGGARRAAAEGEQLGGALPGSAAYLPLAQRGTRRLWRWPGG